MKCISFREERSTAQPLKLELQRLSNIAEHDSSSSRRVAAYQQLLIIISCLSTVSNLEVSDFVKVLKDERDFIYSGNIRYFDEAHNEEISIKSFKIIKKMDGRGFSPQTQKMILGSPIFELRINEENLGFRSIFFVTGKEFEDLFQDFQCYLNAFYKKAYEGTRASEGHTQTNSMLSASMRTYKMFRTNEMKFEHYFTDEESII